MALARAAEAEGALAPPFAAAEEGRSPRGEPLGRPVRASTPESQPLLGEAGQGGLEESSAATVVMTKLA